MQKFKKLSKNISFGSMEFEFIKKKADEDERSFSFIIQKLIKKAIQEEKETQAT